jgi:hypothetical protein
MKSRNIISRALYMSFQACRGIFLLSLLAILSSCEKLVDFPADETGRIYISAMIGDPDNSRISVSVSQPTERPKQEYIKASKVRIEIEADGAFVKVLGTEFMVETPDDKVKVYVADGKVLFARNESADGVILTKGMSATLEAGDDRPVTDAVTDVNSIAWKRGSFIFEDTPLKDVLDCLSKYYKTSFAASDLSKRLSGEFYTDDLDLIIELIESALDVTIVKR